MDRRVALIGLVGLLVVVSGCAQYSFGPTTSDGPGTTTATPSTTTTTPGTTSPGTTPGTTTPGNAAPPDPATDRLGWEGGYWYNESLPINESDGLNATELDMVVNRSMARVEHVRELEFNRTVPVKVVSRAEYREQYTSSGNGTAAFRAFDNAKFELLFLVGEDEDSLAVQEANRGSNVLGFYTPDEDRIVIVSESETPRVTETTLGHELVHALQDQYFDLSSFNSSTRELHNAKNGIVEGDARYVGTIYDRRCGEEWSCTTQPSGGGGGGDLHLGIYIMKYFPYSDGPGFIRHVRNGSGWEAVNDLYRDVPASSEQVIVPRKYRNDAPTDVRLPDRSNGDWSKVSPADRAPYGSVGQASITAMFAYPAYEQSRSGNPVVSPRSFLNLTGSGEVSSTDPINYNVSYANGWDGDKLWVYRNGDGELAYTWRIVWDSPGDAREFAQGYRRLLEYWGGERVDGREDLWHIPEDESGFADAFYVSVDDDTVTIVNAPSTGELSGVWRGAPSG